MLLVRKITDLCQWQKARLVPEWAAKGPYYSSQWIDCRTARMMLLSTTLIWSETICCSAQQPQIMLTTSSAPCYQGQKLTIKDRVMKTKRICIAPKKQIFAKQQRQSILTWCLRATIPPHQLSHASQYPTGRPLSLKNQISSTKEPASIERMTKIVDKAKKPQNTKMLFKGMGCS